MPEISRRRPVRRLFAKVARRDDPFVADLLRTETVGGALLLGAALIALAWANSPWHESYTQLLETVVGPAALDLDIDIAHWAADGLLAIFFFVAGSELKRELVVGDLRDPTRAAVPVVAAVCGVILPAGLYLLITAGDAEARGGWAIPVATDIAFALALLAVVGRHLPVALRTFLLTLAVVDDLIAIVIIAVAYTSDLSVPALAAALVPLAAFGVLAQRRVVNPWLLVPLALAAWTLVHASGVHATVAGVLLAFTLPAHSREDEEHSVCERLEHRLEPISAGVAVPLFALSAAGVRIVDGGLGQALDDVVFIAVVVGLVVGKPIGVLFGTWVTARFTRATLDETIGWPELTGVALLSGVGFTVSLLIGELSFGVTSPRQDNVKLAVLAGSFLAGALAAVALRMRSRRHLDRQLDDHADGRDVDGPLGRRDT